MVTWATLAHELRKSGLSGRQANDSVETIVRVLAQRLGRGEKIELRGFGSFVVTAVKERKRRINGKEVVVPEHGKVLFRPGEVVRKAVWGHGAG